MHCLDLAGKIKFWSDEDIKAADNFDFTDRSVFYKRARMIAGIDPFNLSRFKKCYKDLLSRYSDNAEPILCVATNMTEEEIQVYTKRLTV